MNIYFTSAKNNLNLCKKFYTPLKHMNFLCSPQHPSVFTIPLSTSCGRGLVGYWNGPWKISGACCGVHEASSMLCKSHIKQSISTSAAKLGISLYTEST